MPLQGSHTRQEVDKKQCEEAQGGEKPSAYLQGWKASQRKQHPNWALKGWEVQLPVRWDGDPSRQREELTIQRSGKEGLCCTGIHAQTFDSIPCSATYCRVLHHNMGIKHSTFLLGLLWELKESVCVKGSGEYPAHIKQSSKSLAFICIIVPIYGI